MQILILKKNNIKILTIFINKKYFTNSPINYKKSLKLSPLYKQVIPIYNDSISDFCSQFKVAIIGKKQVFSIRFRKYYIKLLNIFYLDNLIFSYTIKYHKKCFYIFIYLKYRGDLDTNIVSIKRLSTPSRQIYLDVKTLLQFAPIVNITNYILLETSQGLMNHKKAILYNIGGVAILNFKIC